MIRRTFLTTLASAASLFALKISGKRCYGVASWTLGNPLADKCRGGRVLVDGKVIRCVIFVDTEAGVVETLDVMGTGDPIFGKTLLQQRIKFPGRDVIIPIDDVAVELLHGKVELYAPLLSSRYGKYVRSEESRLNQCPNLCEKPGLLYGEQCLAPKDHATMYEGFDGSKFGTPCDFGSEHHCLRVLRHMTAYVRSGGKRDDLDASIRSLFNRKSHFVGIV